MNYDELYFASHLLDPIKDQPHVRVKADTMRSIQSGVSEMLNSLFFGESDSVLISRKDILGIRRRDLDLFTVSVLYWGYPTNNMQRCTHAMESWPQLTELVSSIRFHRNMALDYYAGLEQAMVEINKLNISTYSKMFYFAKASIDGHRCVILDNNVVNGIRLLAGEVFNELKNSVIGMNRYQTYPRYLSAMDSLSQQMGVPAQNLEYALWLAGREHL